MVFRLALPLFLLAPLLCRAQPVSTDLCRAAIAATERATGVPDRLMQAVAEIESGRRNAAGKIAPWPWTINVEGVGQVFETKQEAIAAVTAHRARGARSIDVGCMQVNLMHHADAFVSLDEAFDPVANARYGARFLQQLLVQTGSWPRAVAGYHSLTPDIGAEYARKVMAVWARPEQGQGSTRQFAQVPPLAPGPSAMPGFAPSGPASNAGSANGSSVPYAALPSAAMARTPPPISTGPALTRRGLDSYRAMPTQMALVGPLRRS